MTCLSRETLLETALEKLAEPNKSDSHLTHLETCERCRSTLNEYLNLVRGLRHSELAAEQSAPSLDCLDDNDIAGYCDATLENSRREAVELHLSSCARCLGQYLELRSLLSEVEASAPSVARFVVQVAKRGIQLLAHPAEGFRVLPVAASPVLGSEREESDNAQPIHVWDQVINGFTVRVRLTAAETDQTDVTLEATSDEGPLARAVVYVQQAGRTVQAQTMNNEGVTDIAGLGFGSYLIRIVTSDGGDTVELELDIRES